MQRTLELLMRFPRAHVFDHIAPYVVICAHTASIAPKAATQL